ncbi:hypothetical protein [Aliidiomarina celeris]|uniref:hypothetical protein n=1 Tax=Aliidiomarina celeris TaxID=2249428 RepID=UPI000DEAACE8|nr:hypothetical protein [Aliidiomarina celeris]
MKRGLFYTQRQWQASICIAGLLALVVLLFCHGLLTWLSIELSSGSGTATLATLNSWQVYSLINHEAYWQAQLMAASAPLNHSELWWHPIAAVVAIGFWLALWFLSASARCSRSAAVWLALGLAVLNLGGFHVLQNTSFMPLLPIYFAPLLSFYLAIAALLLSVGHWKQ